MTVCTNDLALCNLVEDALPVSTLKTLGDAELLVPEVVELENDRIGLSAVDAGVLSQVGNQILEALSDDSSLSGPCLLDVSPTVGPVVLLLVHSAARPAVVVALPARLPPPGESLQRLLFMAAPATPHTGDPIQANRRSPKGNFAV
jgi:hypothetical protein